MFIRLPYVCCSQETVGLKVYTAEFCWKDTKLDVTHGVDHIVFVIADVVAIVSTFYHFRRLRVSNIERFLSGLFGLSPVFPLCQRSRPYVTGTVEHLTSKVTSPLQTHSHRYSFPNVVSQ